MIYFICEQSIWRYFEDYIESVMRKIATVDRDTLKIVTDEAAIRSWFLDQQLTRDNGNSYVFVQSDYGVVHNPDMDVRIVNTEQMTRKKYRVAMMRYLEKGYRVIDYSEENVFLLARAAERHLSNNIKCIPYQVNSDEVYSGCEKTKGVCFIGCISPRRQAILRQVPNVSVVRGWGVERDARLFAHKIMVNVHFSHDYGINEQLRINRCVFNRLVVVSERSVYDESVYDESAHDDLLYLRKYIVFCDYDRIADTVRDILDNYESFHASLFRDFDLKDVDAHYSSLCHL
jgi:hypothetical protein